MFKTSVSFVVFGLNNPLTMLLDLVIVIVSTLYLRQDVKVVMSRDLSEPGWRTLPTITLLSIRTTFSASFFTSIRTVLVTWKIYVTWILGF